MSYKTPLQNEATTETIWVEILEPEDLKESSTTQLPSSPEISPAAFTNYLSTLPPGFGALFTLYEGLTLAQHKSNLRVAARRIGLEIKIHSYDDAHLLVALPSKETPKYEKLRPTVFTPIQLAQILKARPVVMLESSSGITYKAFVQLILDENLAEFGGGFLYPLHNGTSVTNQQMGLHIAARSMNFSISTSRWSDHHLLVKFRDYA